MAAGTLSWRAEGEERLPEPLDWLSPREAERASRMRFAKRRNDYLLGRYTAKRAVAQRLALDPSPATLAGIEVVNASDGAPELRLGGRPAALSISLTDRAGWGVCALAPASLAVGCDLELVEPRSERFVRDYFTPSEQDRIERERGEQARDELANLFWSAKESALKVLRTGLRRDTRSVEVALAEERGPGWRGLEVSLAEGPRLPGWWQRFGCFVLSVVASPEAPLPVALGEAAALDRAVPSHRWLDAPLAPREPRAGSDGAPDPA